MTFSTLPLHPNTHSRYQYDLSHTRNAPPHWTSWVAPNLLGFEVLSDWSLYSDGLCNLYPFCGSLLSMVCYFLALRAARWGGRERLRLGEG